MTWQQATQPSDVDSILLASARKPQVLFKHSTRCTISDMAKGRVERQAAKSPIDADFHLLLVVEDRPASNYAAERLHVHHESPQLIVLSAGEVVLDQSHYDIQLDEVAAVLH